MIYSNAKLGEIKAISTDPAVTYEVMPPIRYRCILIAGTPNPYSRQKNRRRRLLRTTLGAYYVTHPYPEFWVPSSLIYSHPITGGKWKYKSNQYSF